MDSNKQVIAIAEYLGWKRGKDCEILYGSERFYPRWYKSGIGAFFTELPDYVNDLNAIHEAENVLTLVQRIAWHHVIGSIVGPSSNMKGGNGFADVTFQLCNATAVQRAKAFLLVIGKWEK